jgi:hypothetical protein
LEEWRVAPVKFIPTQIVQFTGQDVPILFKRAGAWLGNHRGQSVADVSLHQQGAEATLRLYCFDKSAKDEETD